MVRRRALAVVVLVACGRGAQPGAPDGSIVDGDDTPNDADVDGADEPDLVAPKLVSIAPMGDAWLHEPIRFTFDEPIDIAGASATATFAGNPIPAMVALDGDRTISVTIDAIGVGDLEVTLAGTIRDASQNAADVPIKTQLAVPAWNRPAIDRGIANETPAIAIDGTSLVAAWTAGSPKRVVVTRFPGGDLGGALGNDATSVSVTVDATSRPIVAWIEGGAAQVARWDNNAWTMLPSPGSGSRVIVAAERVAVFGATVRVYSLVSDAWQLANEWQSTFTGEPAFTGDATAWISGQTIRAYRGGSAMATISADQATRVSLASRGSQLAIAWDEHGGSMNVVAAIANGSAWTRLGRILDVDAGGDASAPAIALDAMNRVVVAWREAIEGTPRGVIARWTGSAWAIVGGPQWATGFPTKPSLVVLGNAPVVGSASGGAMRLARFNGPATPGAGMTRASLSGCSFNPSNPSPTLFATGCVNHPGLVPYDIVNELWTDGTKKRRWIGLPDGATLSAAGNGSWSAPAGTIIIKEFAIETTPGDPGTRTPVETRIFANASGSWMGFSYKWRANGTDADLLNDGAYTFDWPLTGGGTYRHAYPSRSQCLSCHHSSAGPLLGIRPQQLARWFDYDGKIADQLSTLAAIGVGPAGAATPYISTHDRSATWEQRARSYMAANCAHCHNPNNIAVKDLRYTTPLAQTRLCEVIQPGAPQNSVLYARVTSRPGMPPLGTLAADPLVDNLLFRWISGMTSCP